MGMPGVGVMSNGEKWPEKRRSEYIGNPLKRINYPSIMTIVQELGNEDVAINAEVYSQGSLHQPNRALRPILCIIRERTVLLLVKACDSPLKATLEQWLGIDRSSIADTRGTLRRSNPIFDVINLPITGVQQGRMQNNTTTHVRYHGCCQFYSWLTRTYLEPLDGLFMTALTAQLQALVPSTKHG